LKNIFFEFDKSNILQQSYKELQQLIELLTENPNMKIEIGGHTDDKGTIEYNQRLSENRANAVVKYLINKGISEKRLKYKGYGELHPIDTNETEAGRFNNRRVEFKILDI
jgi:outer membrane protein OmpA-like peptidoglycan-associated protein